jgi:hypothetical protein
MALPKQQSALVKEIAKKYGSVINLKKSPGVLVEILRSYGVNVDDAEACAGGGGQHSIAVLPGPTKPTKPPTQPKPPTPPTPSPSETSDLGLDDVMRAVLNLQRDINSIQNALGQKAAKAGK